MSTAHRDVGAGGGSAARSGPLLRLASVAELTGRVGEHLGYSRWHAVDQDLIDGFADVTGDRQWIHVDADRAAGGPYGATVAHGLLVLSLIPKLAYEVYRVEGVRAVVNYGLDKVRFPAPVRAGSRIRAGVELLRVTPCPGGVQVVNRVTVQVEGGGKPCCVAATVTRFYV